VKRETKKSIHIARMAPPTKILLTGASGYLGQHLLSSWLNAGITESGPSKSDGSDASPRTYIVVAVFHKHPGFESAVKMKQVLASSSPPKVQVIPMSCDLTRQSSVDVLFQEHSSFDVCVHTAALSSPRICEQDPELARNINVPEYFFQKLHKSVRLIALSTDQVFDGTKDTSTQGLYEEDTDIPRPLNVYGQTKLDMETYLLQKTQTTDATTASTVIILRSSIMLGPKAPISQEAHDTFLHFCASRDQQETTFFTNEYRTVVSVEHVCRVIDCFIIGDNPSSSSSSSATIYHMGGPLRVNRYDMAKAVFEYLNYDKKFMVTAEQTSSTSPLDISMSSRRLEDWTKIVHEPTTLEGMVAYTLDKSRQQLQ
jgi:dTDP-4-dehydrorhamnose reductase